MKTKAVLFDMGNTLVKYDAETEAEVFRRVLLSLGISKSVDEIKMAIMNTKQETKDLDLFSLFGKIRSEEYWYRWDSLVLKHLNIDSDEIAKLIQARWFNHLDCSLFPRVKNVLLRLKQMGLKIGLITTAYEEEIAIILGKANLETTMFDIIVGADTIKKVKPDPDAFRYALRELKVRPEETLFIGDNIDADYRGAEEVGIKALLIERREVDSKKTRGLRTITNLKEIFRYLE